MVSCNCHYNQCVRFFLFPLILICCWFYFSPWLCDVMQNVLSLMISVLVRCSTLECFFLLFLSSERRYYKSWLQTCSIVFTPLLHIGDLQVYLLNTLVCGVFILIHGTRIRVPPFDSCHLSSNYQITLVCSSLLIELIMLQTIEALSSVPSSELALRLYLQCAEVNGWFFFALEMLCMILFFEMLCIILFRSPFKKPISKLLPKSIDYFFPSINR